MITEQYTLEAIENSVTSMRIFIGALKNFAEKIEASGQQCTGPEALRKMAAAMERTLENMSIYGGAVQ